MIVTVPMKVMHDLSAPSTPNLLFQKPSNNSVPSHSNPPRNPLGPWSPKAGYNQKISRPWPIYGISLCASYGHHF